MLFFCGFSIAIADRRAAIRKKRNPLAVGRPFEAAIATGMSEQYRGSAIFAIDPDIAPEPVIVPVGSPCSDEYGITIWRNLDLSNSDAIKKFVERNPWRLLLSRCNGGGERDIPKKDNSDE